MKISFAITVCNEVEEFTKLLNFLTHNKASDYESEIVVLQDVSKVSDAINKVFIDFADYIDTRVTSKFEGDFAAWKNMLNGYCTGDFIFQIDADEIPSLETLKYLKALIDMNPDVDLFAVPRRNTVEGLTQEDINKWHWRVEEKWGQQLINYPDWQFRIYKNNGSIKWKGVVHERPVGFKKFGFFPDAMYLTHDKNIAKQRQQNELYSKIQNGK